MKITIALFSRISKLKEGENNSINMAKGSQLQVHQRKVICLEK